jgi:hypothetical protein
MQSETKLVTVSKQWCKLYVNTNKHDDLNLMFANHGKEDGIYPLTSIEIAIAQKKDHQINSKNKMQKHKKWICIFSLLKP